ncbi:GntR family transcriptional regulator [Chloroflexia bacterium SDU3-3]|nr:GntR family transcriptional regulator [Chloroflexia bacterium SDU3-3]
MSIFASQNAPATAAERIAAAIRQEIEGGMIGVGEPLRQEEIAARFAASRIPVREALRLLEAEGLVKIYPSRGAYVTIPAPESIRELYEIRALLECEALRLALPNHIPYDMRQAEQRVALLDEAEDSATWSQLDEELHAILYQPAQRPQLLELIAALRRRVNHFYYLAHRPSDYRAGCQAEHRALLAACRSGDAAQATQALAEHLRHAGEVVARYSAQVRIPR